ncbi:MAG TPA: transcriptional repressor NrdR [Christensenellaceae bacterium]|jgi:transcriptional repressor NrdR|nr:transcriptional repressor NrdR [Christensenellaceae bacterium]
MKCPYCAGEDSRVVDSRPTEDRTSIRRRRECTSCSRRFTTYEKLENVPLLVIKKDQTRELFSPEKIRNGIIQACHKRPVTAQQIDNIVSGVEQMAYNSMKQELTTRQIGEMVMEELRKLDEVAYVRFASVYRQFTDIPSFMHELRQMMIDKKNESL